MASKRVLILDDYQMPIYIKSHSWCDFIEDDDDIDLYIITSTGTLSEKDKSSSRVRVCQEIDHPTTNGTLELLALEMHKKYSLTHVYTREEELIIRAAHIRTLLKIENGLTAETVPFYREKVRMKERASQGGFPVPPFARLFAPADLLGFIEQHGYPVVVKPTLGCATSGLHLLKNEEDLRTYMSSTLFKSIDTDQRMDLVGEFAVEGFMKGSMYHVNGIAQNGRIVHAWPFAYLHTCLGFSQEGKAYGNAYIPQSDPRHQRLCQAAQRLLEILPTPTNGLVFHLELYENLDENRLPDDHFVLCEIAARAPGASITHLMNLVTFPDDEKQSFARLDFRSSVSLPIPTIPENNENKVVTDLILPRQAGKLMFIPRECPIANLEYIPIADVDKPTTYEKYDLNSLNAICRFLAHADTVDEGRALLDKGFEWFQENHINTAPDEPCTVSLIKELHRYFHRKIFV